jgi:hypothetical protein
MKLKDYIKKLQDLADQHPNAIVVYASDSEGNSFHTVGYDPSVGHWDGESFENDEERKNNAVCIN